MVKRFFLFIFIGMLFFALGVTIFLPFADRLTRKEIWEQSLQEVFKRPVSIDGEIEINFFPTPSLIVSSVHLADQISIARMEADLDIFSLMAGEAVFSSLTVRDVDISLARNIPFPTQIEVPFPLFVENVSLALSQSETVIIPAAHMSAGGKKTEGSMRWQHQEFRFSSELGPENGTERSLTLSLSSPIFRARYIGVLLDSFRLNGTLDLRLFDLGALLELKSDAQKIKHFPHPEVHLEGRFMLDTQKADWSEVFVQVGGFTGGGAVHVSFQNEPRVDIEANLPHLGEIKLPETLSSFKELIGNVEYFVREAFPSNVTLSAHIGTTILPYGIVQDIHADVEKSAGGIRVNRLSAVLPGGVPFSAVGELKNGDLDLMLEAMSDDARLFLELEGVDTSFLPPGRFRRLWVRTRLQTSAEQIVFSPLSVESDAFRLESSLVISLRPRPAFGLSFVVDTLSADAYWPSSVPLPRTLEWIPSVGDVDFNVKGKIGHLSYGEFRLNDVVVETTALDGEVRWKVSTAPGNDKTAFLHTDGHIYLRPGHLPNVENVSVDVKVPTPLSSLIKIGSSFPLIHSSVGSAAFSGAVKSGKDKLDVTLGGEVGGIHLRGWGEVNPLDFSRFNGAVAVTHADLSQMAFLFGLPCLKKVQGGFAFSTQLVRRNESAVDFSDLRMRAGPLILAGDATMELSKEEGDTLSAFLHLGEIPLPSLASCPQLLDVIAPSSRLLEDFFDDVKNGSFLFSPHWNVDLLIEGEHVSFLGERFQNPRLLFRSRRQKASLEISSDSLSGGQARGGLDLSKVDGTMSVSGDISLVNIDMSRADHAEGDISAHTERADLNARISGAGGRFAEVLEDLQGHGTARLYDVTITGLDIAALETRIREKKEKSSSEIAFSGKSYFSEINVDLSFSKKILTATAPLPGEASIAGTFFGRLTFPETVLDAFITLKFRQWAAAPALALSLSGPLGRVQRSLDGGDFEKWYRSFQGAGDVH